MKKFVLLVFLIFTSCALAQDKQALPVSTETLLRGVTKAQSKDVIKSVLMIVCMKDQKKGTGFVLTGGNVITTNSHVVGNCSAQDLFGISSVTNEQVRFTAMQVDANRDLALLCTSKPLPFSLKLGSDEQPAVETEVETWGYPLSYHAPAPLLSRGYVAGYNADVRQPGATPVKHLVINGAFNPGNSGGPLIDRGTGKVIGIVVTKWTLWSPDIQAAIQGFSHPSVGTGGTFSKLNAQGQRVGVTDQEMISNVLDEFYQMSQVMIGEAISVSELSTFVKEKEKDLACVSK
jgi:S1-C subfamily serine protease